MNEQRLAELERAEKVSIAVWKWLSRSRAQQFVPWVINPACDSYDPIKAGRQAERHELLAELDAVIHGACGRECPTEEK